VPVIQDIEIKHVARKKRWNSGSLSNNKDSWRFMAENMSDGTLRALGVLTALFQSRTQMGRESRWWN
jgi:hypothetical protein